MALVARLVVSLYRARAYSERPGQFVGRGVLSHWRTLCLRWCDVRLFSARGA